MVMSEWAGRVGGKSWLEAVSTQEQFSFGARAAAAARGKHVPRIIMYSRQVASTYKDTAHPHLLVASTGCLHHSLPTPQYLLRHTKTISQPPPRHPQFYHIDKIPTYHHDALPPLPRLRALHSSRNGISSSILASNLPSFRQHFPSTITTEQCRVWSAHESPKSNKPVRWTGGHQEWNEPTTSDGCSHSLGPGHGI